MHNGIGLGTVECRADGRLGAGAARRGPLALGLPALGVLALLTCGCGIWRNDQPTPTFANSAPPPVLRPTPRADLVVSRLTLAPRGVIAPVGAEIPLVCSLCEGGYVPLNQRVDWELTAESVGEFTAASLEPENNFFAPLDFQPQLSPRRVVGVTSAREIALPQRGLPAEIPSRVRAGEAYAVLRSREEGASTVVVTAPVTGTERVDGTRRQSAVIYWIDAQWVFPQSAVEPAGTSHRLTTTLRRQTDGAPKPGWRVRYEIAGGAAAGFAPDLAQAAEATTDADGNASVELLQREPARGTTLVRMHVIRPAELGGQPLIVGQGAVEISWTAEVGLRITGPARASPGQELTYHVEVANPTQAALRNLVVDVGVPRNLTFVSSMPAASRDEARRQVQWRLSELAPGGRANLHATFRADAAGTANVCASLNAAGGLAARQCATTAIGLPKVQLTLKAPREAELQQKATFQIEIANLGPGEAGGLSLRAYLDEGLAHASGSQELKQDLGTLEEGQTASRRIDVTIVRANELCVRVEVHGPGGLLAGEQACARLKLGLPPPPEETRPAISATLTVAETAQLDEEITLKARITNSGQSPLTNITAVQKLPEGLFPLQATSGHGYQFTTQHELSWKLARLDPGQTWTLDIQCRCEAAGRQCATLAVSAAPRVSANQEACVMVQASETALKLEISDSTDPVLVGREVIYRIKVSNPGTRAQKNVVVEATLPEGVTLLPVGTGAAGFTYHQERQQVKFSPIKELKAGGAQEFRLVVRADTAGRIVVKATARGEGGAQTARAEAGTDVNANQ